MMHMNTNPHKKASKEGMYAQLGENSRQTRDKTKGHIQPKKQKEKERYKRREVHNARMRGIRSVTERVECEGGEFMGCLLARGMSEAGAPWCC